LAWVIEVSNFTALYDACVLYPAPLRDLLMYVAVTDLYRARWSNAIHDEWIGNLLRHRPDLTAEQLQRTRELMNAHVRDCLVAGYESLIPALTLPDPNDRHVLAAAIHCGANVIVTFNLRHFPDDTLKPFGIEAQHPDDFLNCQLDLAPNIVCAAAKRQRTGLKNPPKTVEQYLESLERQGLAKTVSVLRRFAELI
jgi:PIN domain